MSTILLSLVWLTTPAPAAEVDVSGRVWRELLPPDAPQPEKGPGPWVSARDVELAPRGDAVRLRASWTIHAIEPGWVDLPLVDASVRVDRATLGGQPVALKSLSDGRRHLVARVDRPGELVLEGELVGDLRRGLELALLAAPVGRLAVRTPDRVVDVRVGDEPAIGLGGAFWTGANVFSVRTQSERAARKTDQLALGAVGLGVTVGDGDVRVRGRLRWRIARGELDEVTFTARGAGPDLDVTGPAVARWDREGERVRVALRRTEDALVELDVRWSQPLPAGDEARVPLPELALDGVFRTERALQIARDGDREVLPGLDGWTATASSELPDVARDLVVGTPTSAWTTSGGGAGALSLLRFVPVSGPPTLVDVAAYDGALSADGRLLMRAHYSVRNDRGAFLRVRLPPRTQVVGARVGGEPATIARDGEVWLVPLLKSVETVQGLIDFPVDLLLITDGDPFAKRDERALPLPVLDVEVAVTRVTLHLPVGWRDRLEPGEDGRVDEFSEGQGITYGFSSGEANKVAEADRLFQDALKAWMGNEFDAAEQALSDLRDLGASNANIERLQSNLDLVTRADGLSSSGSGSGGGGGADVALQRRVKEQAMARASRDQSTQQELLDEADKAYFAGDYDAAEQSYQRALEIGQTLERLEQEESREVQSSNVKVAEKLAKAKSESSKKKDASSFTARTVVEFDDVEIEGELVKPDGAYEIAIDEAKRRAEAEAAAAAAAAAERLAFERAREAEHIAREGRDAELDARRQAEERARAEAAGATLTKEFLQSVPSGRSYQSVIEASEAAGRGPKGAPPPAPPPTSPTLPAPAPEPGFAPLEITASSLDVVIPAFGDTVRYQHLLLPAGQAHAVALHIKKKRRDR